MRPLSALLITTTLLVAGCGGGDDATTTTVASNGSDASTSTSNGETPDSITTVPTDDAGSSTTTSTAGSTTASGPGEDASELELALAPDGLVIVEASGSTTLLPFGTAEATVRTAMEATLGPPSSESQSTDECPNGRAGVAVWPDAILVDFDENGEFLSWVARTGSDLTDLTGVGLDSTRAELEETWTITVEETTLGVEFATAPDGTGLGGLLSGNGDDAVITDLWAGPVCAFR